MHRGVVPLVLFCGPRSVVSPAKGPVLRQPPPLRSGMSNGGPPACGGESEYAVAGGWARRARARQGTATYKIGNLGMAQVARYKGAVPTKAARLVEDGRGEESRVAPGVQGPVPVRLAELGVPAAAPEGLLVLRQEQTVERVEDALQQTTVQRQAIGPGRKQGSHTTKCTTSVSAWCAATKSS